ncbi:hypothetical protein B0T20DRAFT_398414 [Sordaria brevicollis]|uniref:Uncharacterized protein n=1 Tax=Sordaria brevicollis TaxID=83679 RepID=A0AAE0UFU9_SORBR|nr:hypothetical protein B0T20DRAFT_398414 [Sordaria brevicollis]
MHTQSIAIALHLPFFLSFPLHAPPFTIPPLPARSLARPPGNLRSKSSPTTDLRKWFAMAHQRAWYGYPGLVDKAIDSQLTSPCCFPPSRRAITSITAWKANFISVRGIEDAKPCSLSRPFFNVLEVRLIGGGRLGCGSRCKGGRHWALTSIHLRG